MSLRYTKPNSRPSLHGFTLVELMVVIVIIVVLAALAFLGMNRVRDMADKAASIRNLSQLQVANASYAADHNGNFVAIRANDSGGKTTRWFEDADYLRNLMGEVLDSSGRQSKSVPIGLLDPKVVRARQPLYDRLYTSYGMNDTGLKLGGEPNLNSYNSVNRIRNPTRSMAFATATDFRVNYNSRFKWDFDDPKDIKTSDGSIAYRHNKKILVVYYDGHVGEMSKADLQEIDRSRRGKNSAFWLPTQ